VKFHYLLGHGLFCTNYLCLNYINHSRGNKSIRLNRYQETMAVMNAIPCPTMVRSIPCHHSLEQPNKKPSSPSTRKLSSLQESSLHQITWHVTHSVLWSLECNTLVYGLRYMKVQFDLMKVQFELSSQSWIGNGILHLLEKNEDVSKGKLQSDLLWTYVQIIFSLIDISFGHF